MSNIEPATAGPGQGASRPPALLFVHAHPDDESQTTGGAIAHYLDLGCHVCVVTCTQGEEGRIGVPELAHLAADQDDALGPERARELQGAMRQLGVTDHRFLVRGGYYRDSGRMGRASNLRADAFWQADIDEASSWLAEVIRQLRPEAVVTYDPFGGYGHPDHIQTHRVAMRALDLAADESRPRLAGDPWMTPRVFWCAVPRTRIVADLKALAAQLDARSDHWVDLSPEEYPDGVHDDAAITTDLDVSDVLGRKSRAMAQHRTQLSVHGSYWTLASGRAMPVQDHEWFIRVRPGVQPDGPVDTGLLSPGVERSLADRAQRP